LSRRTRRTRKTRKSGSAVHSVVSSRSLSAGISTGTSGTRRSRRLHWLSDDSEILAETSLASAADIRFRLDNWRLCQDLVRADRATFSRLGDWVQTIGLFALFGLTQDFTVVTGACCAVIHFEYFAVLVNPVHFLHETWRSSLRRRCGGQKGDADEKFPRHCRVGRHD